jgi:alpha-tubulin suppressor-like RCC1 family protein
MTTFHDSGDLPRFTELDAEYEILHELGRGGTAVVYLARERELGRRVAIKVIRSVYVEDEEAAARLVREARMVGGLQHPNIVVLYGTRRLRDRSLALIMQFVPGRTLKAEVEGLGPLPYERVEQILGDVGSALAYAHRHRIVHRDIKPENVYLDDDSGVARLSDFGIARPWDSESGLTLPGTAIGTPAYMSPEQIDGGRLDGRSDLYSLGMVGYEMLTGRRPWAGESLFSIIYKQKNARLPPLDQVRPGIPPPLQRAVEGALFKDPADRWPDAERFLEVLGGGRAARRFRGQPAHAAAAATEAGSAASPAVEPATPESAATAAEGLTIQYRRPAGEVMAAAQRAAAAERPGARRRAAAAAAMTAAAMAPEPVETPGRRRATLAVAGLLFVLAGTAVAAAVNAWSDGPRAAPSRETTTAPAASIVTPAPAEVAGDGMAAEAAVAYAMMGADQEAAVGDTLPQPLVVRVEDAAGRPAAGVGVRFRIAAGEGVLLPSTAVTDSTGMAAARWLVLSAGIHRAEAVIADAGQGSTIDFTATAVAHPARLVSVSSTELAGTAAATPAPLLVRAEDERGNPVAGVRVRFAVQSGGGTIAPATGVTGSDGTTQAAWVLGAHGPQEASARITNVPNTTVVFSAGSTGPPPLPVRSGLVAGGTHTCALAADGSLACWGGNDRGQLGDGSTVRREGPARITVPEPPAAIAAGVTHSCAVSTAATLYCWGSNASGQLGDGTQTNRALPARVQSEERLTSVAVGATHSCAVAASGALFCWGDNTHGQLGDGSRASRSTPVRAGGSRRFRAVSLGWTHTCGIGTDGLAYCWGRNAGGQLGDGSSADRAGPVPVAGGHHFTALAAGSSHTCGLRGDGVILCWGQDSHGQLGTGTLSPSPVPVPVDGQDRFAAVAAGALHTCALTQAGAALCWGRNIHGQLGDGTTENQSRPTAVAGGLAFRAIVASGAHSCGSVADGGWHCWGYNMEGQLGDGTRENQLRPRPVARR